MSCGYHFITIANHSTAFKKRETIKAILNELQIENVSEHMMDSSGI